MVAGGVCDWIASRTLQNFAAARMMPDRSRCSLRPEFGLGLGRQTRLDASTANAPGNIGIVGVGQGGTVAAMAAWAGRAPVLVVVVAAAAVPAGARLLG